MLGGGGKGKRNHPTPCQFYNEKLNIGKLKRNQAVQRGRGAFKTEESKLYRTKDYLA